ncbi:hypothetical protein BJ170DRAFT_693553 [Xylariales sp. AK1849]|nr:hypothetical protein BJ170DRAFT_693553 [Xylariales sp. AK1849]
MVRRRSARLASSSQNEKPSLVPRLGSVTEGDESHTENPTQSLDAIMSSPIKPSTPVGAALVKLPMSEMHPSKVHQTMAPPSSGLKLGFVDINADPRSRDHASGATQVTPSKTPLRTSDFTFRVTRPTATEMSLGPEAQRMMDELREEAAKIKADLVARREQEREEEAALFPEGRKIATAKGKASRFSDIHMAEFKKMDSIANHPSAYRAVPGRSTPVKSGIKRSQSKANLDEPESASRKATSVRAVPKSAEKQREEPESPTKRVRQRIEDDASTLRPVSRDASAIPRPKSSGNDSVRSGIPRSQTMASLMTPTKASVARANVTKTPTIALVRSPSKPELTSLTKFQNKTAGLGALMKSPTRPDLGSLIKSPSKSHIGGSLKKSLTLGNMGASQGIPTLVQTPGRFDRVKSILKRQFSASKPKSHLPQFAVPKTPGRSDREPAVVPLTTPGQKFGKHVEFTPDTKQATLTQNSPSPTKSSIPRSKTNPKLTAPSYLSFGTVIGTKRGQGEVAYPDLSSYGADPEEEVESDEKKKLPDSVPGTFTFRSDHTIHFESASPKGFGASSGQASLRHVRKSVASNARMPGSFPRDGESSPNKENDNPAISGIPHGMSNKKRHRAIWEDEEVKSGISHGISNKKRHRASWDDEDDEDEGAQRGAKKLRKDPPAEGEALVAPRLAASSPIKKPAVRAISCTPSPQKKKASLSLSRLNMLARPKHRK